MCNMCDCNGEGHYSLSRSDLDTSLLGTGPLTETDQTEAVGENGEFDDLISVK